MAGKRQMFVPIAVVQHERPSTRSEGRLPTEAVWKHVRTKFIAENKAKKPSYSSILSRIVDQNSPELKSEKLILSFYTASTHWRRWRLAALRLPVPNQEVQVWSSPRIVIRSVARFSSAQGRQRLSKSTIRGSESGCNWTSIAVVSGVGGPHCASYSGELIKRR